jgi:hypothetical protein
MVKGGAAGSESMAIFTKYFSMLIGATLGIAIFIFGIWSLVSVISQGKVNSPSISLGFAYKAGQNCEKCIDDETKTIDCNKCGEGSVARGIQGGIQGLLNRDSNGNGGGEGFRVGGQRRRRR